MFREKIQTHQPGKSNTLRYSYNGSAPGEGCVMFWTPRFHVFLGLWPFHKTSPQNLACYVISGFPWGKLSIIIRGGHHEISWHGPLSGLIWEHPLALPRPSTHLESHQTPSNTNYRIQFLKTQQYPLEVLLFMSNFLSLFTFSAMKIRWQI